MSAFWYYVFTLVFFLFDYFILAMGLNIQYGETGILNFAYIGFVAIGAYVTGAVSLASESQRADSVSTTSSGCALPFPINLLDRWTRGERAGRRGGADHACADCEPTISRWC